MFYILTLFMIYVNSSNAEEILPDGTLEYLTQHKTNLDEVCGSLDQMKKIPKSLEKILKEKDDEIKKLRDAQKIKKGFHLEKYDPFSALDDYNLNDPTNEKDIADKKQQVKKILQNKGCIPDADKPLLLFVGKFKKEKGTEFLETAAKEWENLGGQVIFMTNNIEDNETKNRLTQMIKNKELKFTYFINSDDSQITGPNKTCDTSMGNSNGILIRFASDFTLIPSRTESCGIIALESLALGSLPITSWVDGIKNIIDPLGQKGENLQLERSRLINKDSFNGYSYFYDPKEQISNKSEPENKNRLREALSTAMRTITQKENNIYYPARLRAINKIHNGDYSLE